MAIDRFGVVISVSVIDRFSSVSVPLLTRLGSEAAILGWCLGMNTKIARAAQVMASGIRIPFGKIRSSSMESDPGTLRFVIGCCNSCLILKELLGPYNP